MKKEIHPKYEVTTFACACGTEILTRSVRGGRVSIDTCSKCHPFFSGKQRFVDVAGRIDRFKKKFGDAVNTGSAGTKKKAAKSA